MFSTYDTYAKTVPARNNENEIWGEKHMGVAQYYLY
jgi:hypothetical protein